MKAHLTTLALAALAAPGLGLQAQEGGKQNTPTYGDTARTSKSDYAGVSEILGTQARLKTTTGDAEKVQIEDLIVNVDTGYIDWAIVDAGSRMVAVPASLLACNRKMDGEADEKELVLDVDRAKLDTLPAFDLKASRDRGLDSSLVVLESSWAGTAFHRGGEVRTTEAGAARTPTVLVAGTEFVTLPGRYVPITEIDDAEVFARRDEFGSIDDLILEPNEHKIAFAVVSHGGVLGIGDKKYLVPFSALHTGQPKDESDKTVLCIDMPADAIAVEPARYEKPDEGLVSSTNAESAKRVFSDAAKKRGAEKKDMKDKGMEKRSGG